MKKLISIVIVITIMVSTCCISAFAALDYTETYYMNGYKLNGNTVMNNSLVSSSTYCEKINYGKATEMYYYYYYNHKVYSLAFGSSDTFVTNGLDTYSVSYTYTPTTDEYVGAIGKHRVKASSYMVWSSHASEDDSVVGNIVPDYSDL